MDGSFISIIHHCEYALVIKTEPGVVFKDD